MLDSAPFLSELAGWVEWLHEPTANYVRQLDSWAKLSWEAAAGFISELGESTTQPPRRVTAQHHSSSAACFGSLYSFLSSPETIGRRSIRHSRHSRGVDTTAAIPRTLARRLTASGT